LELGENIMQTDEAVEQAAVRAAEKWLALVDARNFEESWEDTASLFKSGISEKHFFKSGVSKQQWQSSLKTAQERYLAALFGTLVLAACSTAPVTRNEAQTASPTQVSAPELQKASIDQVVQFLLTAAANDFHTHRQSDSVRFRDVRIGHVMTPSGAEQYMLCGQFLPAQEGSKAEWTPFATIKTSGYEQWNGGQAVGFCQSSSVIWDKVGDLSSSLQSRFDSLR
jgi:hypothetical protein